jgi:UDP-N-acetylmuramoylalanine--D-glutamate ligase
MARQGLALARFFVVQGALVTISDLRPERELATACADLLAYAAKHAPSGVSQSSAKGLRSSKEDVPPSKEDVPRSDGLRPAVRFVLGSHPLSLLEGADLLCLSGGVSPQIPIARAAVERGIPLSNDALLTLRHCPVPVVAITGSAGKTTTTTLVGLMLEAAGYTVHVGGNIGTPLLDRLETIRAGDKVVMELSSFQLELFDQNSQGTGTSEAPVTWQPVAPTIAAILNITPNHLDRHPSMSHYTAAKANILRHQDPGDTCVLSADDQVTGPWLASGRCQIAAGSGQPAVYFPLRAARLGFSLAQEVSAGAFLRGDALIWRRPGLPDVTICRAAEVRLRGRHNLANVLAACCLAGAAGAGAAAIAQVATSFGGVEHRLEIVRRRNGVLWVNDSIATAPERTIAALRTFSEPMVLLAGGRDKKLSWDECAAVIHEVTACGQRVRHVVLFGEAASLIGEALAHYERETGAAPVPATHCADLPAAVAAAAKVARAGDVVLLAPGGTSFDAYEDFAARGQHFRALVEALP